MTKTTCILTGKEVEYKTGNNNIHYNLTFAGNEVTIFICSNCKSKIISKTPHHIIEGLIANKKWPERSFIISKDCTSSTNAPVESETIILSDYIHTAPYPKTPKEKLDQLFLNLYYKQNYDGESFSVELANIDFLKKNYFINPAECLFYVDGLQVSGLIKHITTDYVSRISITHLGLNKAIQLLEEGDKSNKCFIAMSFDPSTNEIRETIREALYETGYEAVIIDEQIIDSQKTINDEIIASLKKCKFCIADFSLHSNGVYFESGFALGQGKKVIYTCSKEEFDKAHFDIKPLQHIVYKSKEQLKKELIHKIEAYIN